MTESVSAQAVPNSLAGHYACVQSNGRAGRFIQAWEDSPANHVIFAISETEAVEAIPSGVHKVSLVGYPGILAWSDDPLTPEQVAAGVALALTLINEPYGWLDVIAGGLWVMGIHLPWVMRRIDNPDKPATDCSHLVTTLSAAEGLDLLPGIPKRIVTPSMLYSRILSRSHRP